MVGAAASSRAAAKKPTKESKAVRAKPKPGSKGESGEELRTKSGALLTPEMEADLAAEAEAGYDVSKLVPRKPPEGHPCRGVAAYEMIRRVAEDVGRRPSELVREVLQAAYSRK